jgi:hypothetical protein
MEGDHWLDRHCAEKADIVFLDLQESGADILASAAACFVRSQ